MTKTHCKWWSVLLVSLLLCGCAEKLTYQRWETIHNGDLPEVVKATLGEPWQTTDMAWVYYNDDHRHINSYVYFEADKVIGKTWSDPQRGMVGSTPHVKQSGESEESKVKIIK